MNHEFLPFFILLIFKLFSFFASLSLSFALSLFGSSSFFPLFSPLDGTL